MTAILLLVCFLFGAAFTYPSPQPIIGLMIQEDLHGSCKGQYVFSAYKSFIEQGGGGVVPVFVNQSDSYYEQLIPRLNGVLLPGGDIKHVTRSPFGKAAVKIQKMAMTMNDAGIHYPIWATCQGFEDMTTWPSGRNQLSKCIGTDSVSLPVNFTPAAMNSKLYGSMPLSLVTMMREDNLTANNHDLCLSSHTYNATKQMNQFFTVLTTNVDSAGLEYVSSMESKKYPFYGVQFHPEKANFFNVVGNRYNHSPGAILVSQYMSDFLVAEAKRNSNAFRSLSEEGRFLINNFQSRFNSRAFIETYCFTDEDIPPFDQL
ncbi:gamma-glutamyl hydrolase-like [Watersipora subatra]|uniref:gamma-glutamyl hydrolase-like n=1 Tax=Watersipora subatra TaxID=2589382 RepID=UPI00355C7E38